MSSGEQAARSGGSPSAPTARSAAAVEAAEVIRLAARAFERDRYLAALLSPPSARDDLIVLSAFAGEVQRIPAFVSEPMLGEIRLQWWRDALAAARLVPGTSSGHPVADAMAQTIARHRLPAETLDGFIDAVALGLGPQPMADHTSLDAYLDATQGALFALAARVLGADPANPDDEIFVAAGRAYGIARIGLEAGLLAGEGRTLLPQAVLDASGARIERIATGEDWTVLAPHLEAMAAGARGALRQVRRLLRGAPAPLHCALRPLALVEPYLRVSERERARGTSTAMDVLPLTRVWRLARARVTGAL